MPTGDDGSMGSKIRVHIVDIMGTGRCPLGHTVGEEFDLTGDAGKICPAAMHVIYPYVRVLQFGGEFPWEVKRDRKGRTRICCSDPDNPVVFEVFRVEE